MKPKPKTLAERLTAIDSMKNLPRYTPEQLRGDNSEDREVQRVLINRVQSRAAARQTRIYKSTARRRDPANDGLLEVLVYLAVGLAGAALVYFILS